MSRHAWLGLLTLGMLLFDCEENRATGNDREAQLSPPEPAAEVLSVGAAIGGVANGLLLPQPMTEADLRTIPGAAARCFFSYTRVGLPVFTYGTAGVMKLNGKLISLPSLTGGRFAADDLSVTVRPLEESREGREPFVAQLILWLPGADHERGFQGISRCEASAR